MVLANLNLIYVCCVCAGVEDGASYGSGQPYLRLLCVQV
jgi:hypothetical protein